MSVRTASHTASAAGSASCRDAYCSAHIATPSLRGVRGAVRRQSVHSHHQLGQHAAFSVLMRRVPRFATLRVHASEENRPDNQEPPPFGYTRKDVLLLGFGIIGFGYALYYGLQGAGVDALVAGNFVQLFVFLGIGVGYISTYLFRVANKEMTYVKQLEDYEEAVMKKRLEEMPEVEKERLLTEIEQEKEQRRQQLKQ